MKFLAIPFLALFATSALAVDCGQIVPACAGGSITGQTDCRCDGQVAPCDVWNCPGAPPNVQACGQYGSGCVFI